MEQAGASYPLHLSSIVHPADSVLIPVIAPSSISRICLHLQTGVNSCMSVCWCCFLCSPCLKLTCMCQVWGARGLVRYVELWVRQRQLLDRAQQWFFITPLLFLQWKVKDVRSETPDYYICGVIMWRYSGFSQRNVKQLDTTPRSCLGYRLFLLG